MADPQIVFIENETKDHKKLEPVDMYWRSREIYESECVASYAENTTVVDVSVEDPLDVV